MVSRVPEPVTLADERVLVTGASGFVGQHLVRGLAEAGTRVYAAVFPGELPERVEALPASAERLTFDIRDASSVQAAITEAKPQVVFHLAAVGVTNSSELDPRLALEVNVGGVLHLLEALRARDLRRIVLVGTCYEYGAREAVEGLDPFNTVSYTHLRAHET